MTAIFQLNKPSGRIILDSVDILKLPVHDARRPISAVPRYPYLFSSTIKANIDPLNQYTDFELWKVLESVQLSGKVKSLPSQIETVVTNHDGTFTNGEKQLLCLARALLGKTYLVIIEESTDGKEDSTDSIIQHVISKHLKHCSVIIIASKLKSIRECDKIYVFGNGKIIEEGTFDSLLSIGGLFRQLV